jgi:hypothetical protein
VTRESAPEGALTTGSPKTIADKPTSVRTAASGEERLRLLEASAKLEAASSNLTNAALGQLPMDAAVDGAIRLIDQALAEMRNS